MRRRKRFVCALLLLFSTMGLEAADLDVVLVRGDTGPVYRQFERAFVDRLHELHGAGVQITRLAPVEIAARVAESGVFPPASYLVPVGSQAAEAIAGYSLAVPTYFSLIPAAAYQALARRFQENLAEQRSAVFIDQPIERSLELIRLALPTRRRVGVLLGPTSEDLRPRLVARAEQLGLELRLESVPQEQLIYGRLEAMSEDIDVLLAVPDPLLYNRYTIRTLLMTTYRHGIPVIGYSNAFVTAGALAAVYSDPEQIGRQTAEGLAAGIRAETPALPPPDYPHHFSVAVNFWVAQALGLDVPKEDVLLHRLRRAATGG